LLAELAEWDGYVSSALLGVESIRACARYGETYAAEARTFLLDIALLPIDDAVLEEATSIEPAGVRTLDALHLATALSIRDELGAFVAFDQRLVEAAKQHGLTVLPGSSG
jgi:predicted nucleic acid-binding protein